MLRYVWAVLLLFILSFFIITGCGTKGTASAKAAVTGSEKAADFTLASLEGEKFSLSTLAGKKAALLDFTTTWCPHCVAIIPEVKDIYTSYKDKGLEVIAVYINEKKSDVEEFAKKHNIPYKVLLDTDGAAASKYGVVGVPTIIIVDKNGIIRHKAHNISKDAIQEVIE